jgi:hypothetical protein
VNAPANCRLIGRWRIVEPDLRDRAHLDLCGPATLTITAWGGKIAFGALEAGLEVEYARDSIGFRWAGREEGDQAEGEGTAELLDDGSVEIEFAYHNGDEAVLKAKRVTSSTACWSSPTSVRSRMDEELESGASPLGVPLKPVNSYGSRLLDGRSTKPSDRHHSPLPAEQLAVNTQ